MNETEVLRCACGCEMTTVDLRRRFPFAVTIAKPNFWELPVGKRFPFARFRHDAKELSEEVEVLGHWPMHFHGQRYLLFRDQVEIHSEPRRGGDEACQG